MKKLKENFKEVTNKIIEFVVSLLKRYQLYKERRDTFIQMTSMTDRTVFWTAFTLFSIPMLVYFILVYFSLPPLLGFVIKTYKWFLVVHFIVPYYAEYEYDVLAYTIVKIAVKVFRIFEYLPITMFFITVHTMTHDVFYVFLKKISKDMHAAVIDVWYSDRPKGDKCNSTSTPTTNPINSTSIQKLPKADKIPIDVTNSLIITTTSVYSPLEIFEIESFDYLNFEINETFAFFIFSLLAITVTSAAAGGGESSIEEDEDGEDFEDEDFTSNEADSLLFDNLGDNDDDDLDTIVSLTYQSVLFSNLANLIPFGDSNSNFLIFTIYLAGTCFLALNFNGFLIHTIGMIKLFLPQGVPTFLKPLLFVIEFISYFARLFSLGIRLFANMLSGHILMAILSTFAVILLLGLNLGSFASILLILVITCIFFLEIIICYLQSYVFAMLVTIYYGDALNLHH